MSENKWTKGPWEVKIPKRSAMTKRPSIEIDGKCSFVADFWGSCENAKANAILASTAPELYEALEDTHLAMSSNVEGYNGSYAAKRNADALAKARGDVSNGK
jgi:hypothetical protein